MIELRPTLTPGVSICEQIVYAARKAIVSGQLQPGDPFPSVRALSKSLKINPNTVQKAVARLTAEGLVEMVPGIGTLVKERSQPNQAARSDLLRNKLERLAVEAKQAGLELDDVTAALAYHWRALGRALGNGPSPSS